MPRVYLSLNDLPSFNTLAKQSYFTPKPGNPGLTNDLRLFNQPLPSFKLGQTLCKTAPFSNSEAVFAHVPSPECMITVSFSPQDHTHS